MSIDWETHMHTNTGTGRINFVWANWLSRPLHRVETTEALIWKRKRPEGYTQIHKQADTLTHTHAHRCVLTHTVTQINITVRSNKNSQDSTMFSVRTVSNVCVCTPPHICIICSHLCSLREHFCCVIPVIVSQKIKVLHGIAIWHICSALRGAEWARELRDFRSYRNVLVFCFFFAKSPHHIMFVATNVSDILILHPYQRKKIAQLQFVVNEQKLSMS